MASEKIKGLVADLDDKKSENREHKKPHHDVPPHILKEIMDLKEKVGRIEGQLSILTKIIDKK